MIKIKILCDRPEELKEIVQRLGNMVEVCKKTRGKPDDGRIRAFVKGQLKE